MDLRLAESGKTFSALPGALPRVRRGGDYLLTYRAEWDHLCEVARNDARPIASARDGLAATRIARAARQAVITGTATAP
jgi:predicted dehydrogenase